MRRGVGNDFDLSRARTGRELLALPVLPRKPCQRDLMPLLERFCTGFTTWLYSGGLLRRCTNLSFLICFNWEESARRAGGFPLSASALQDVSGNPLLGLTRDAD